MLIHLSVLLNFSIIDTEKRAAYNDEPLYYNDELFRSIVTYFRTSSGDGNVYERDILSNKSFIKTKF